MERLRLASGSSPAGRFARAGLRWCGGWRRANLGGSHDQAQIQAKGCDPPNNSKDQQISRAIGARIVQAGNGPHTKQAAIIAMLRTPAGATIASLVTATDWQQHSVRGFLAGVVRKKLGLNLISEQTDKGRVYRIKDGKGSSAASVKQAA